MTLPVLASVGVRGIANWLLSAVRGSGWMAASGQARAHCLVGRARYRGASRKRRLGDAYKAIVANGYSLFSGTRFRNSGIITW